MWRLRYSHRHGGRNIGVGLILSHARFFHRGRLAKDHNCHWSGGATGTATLMAIYTAIRADARMCSVCVMVRVVRIVSLGVARKVRGVCEILKMDARVYFG